MSEVIKLGQQHSINYCGIQIVVDGIWGPESKANGIRCLQIAMNQDYGSGLAVDGLFGVNSSNSLDGHYVKEGESQEMVRALQIGLMLRGYDPNGVDAIFGHGTWVAVIDYQRDHGLEADGIAGILTLCSVFDVEMQQGGSEDQGDWRNIDPNNLVNFSPDEFKCQCGCGRDVCDELKQKAQALRNRIGMPMVITDGFRCPSYNAHEGGTPDSLHMQGMAFDFQIPGHRMTRDEMLKYRQYCHECGLTCGIYEADAFIHCQIGRWDWNEDF